MTLKLVPGRRSCIFLTLCAVILIVIVYISGVLLPFVACVNICRSEIMLLRQRFRPKIQENYLICVILLKAGPKMGSSQNRDFRPLDE